MRALVALFFCGVALVPCAEAANVSEKFDLLVSHSPFGKADSASGLAPAATNPLEFRAVLEEPRYRLFSLFETSRHRSAWVEIGKPEEGIVVKEFDEGKLTIEVEYLGKLLTLPLKGAIPQRRVLVTAPTAPPITTETTDPEYHDRPFRIGHVLEEVEIRHAVRAQASVSPEATVPPGELPPSNE
jgi:hypothetical protein